MEDIKRIVADNLCELRKQHKWTQSELATKLNYSDKAISKWENGDALPSVDILYEIANLYGVTLDYLTHTGTRKEKSDFVVAKDSKQNKIVISLLAVSVVWILATCIFAYAIMIFDKNYWTLFIWAFPISFVLAIIFNGIWGQRKYTFVYSSLFVWTLLLSFFLQFLEYNFWVCFILGVPIQISIALWSTLKPQHKK